MDEFEDYDVLIAKAKAAKLKAAKFERQAAGMAKQVRDLEKDLAGSEHKCAVLEGAVSDVQQKCDAAAQAAKAQEVELQRLAAELGRRETKVAVLESRVLRASLGDASLDVAARPKPAGKDAAGFWGKLRCG